MQQTPPPKKFTAEMPQIPGLSDSPAPSSPMAAMAAKPALLSIGLGAILVLVGGIVWWTVHAMSRPAPQAPVVTQLAPAAPVELPPLAPATTGPVTAATLDELARPWSSKEFTFVDPVTHDSVPAIVIHLPGGAAGSSAAYWAFSLEAPLQTCHLEYVTDLHDLAARFGYHGVHPMVASACDGSVYDPLQMATIDSGAWVRGAIVQGAGIRPPIVIEIKVEGNNLVADRIE